MVVVAAVRLVATVAVSVAVPVVAVAVVSW